jgi:uncharacterized protein
MKYGTDNDKYIDLNPVIRLEQQLKSRAIWIEPKIIPPYCRTPKELPVLAIAIDGKAKIIVSGDDDLRADRALREAMALHSIELLGVNSFLKYLGEPEK